MNGLLLLSSDDRTRYAEDIQTAIALPEGGIIQFRYRMRWISPELQDEVRANRVNGRPAVLGFVSADRSTSPFVLPVRYATVARTEVVADMVLFQLRVRGYPNLDLYPSSFAEIVALSRGVIGQLKRNSKGRFYSATSNFPAMPHEILDDAPKRWLATARLLALHPTFKESYFLRVAPVETTRRKLAFDAEGNLASVDGESLRIATQIFATHYSRDGDFRLTCLTDETNLRVASDNVYHVALRYDSIKFWLHPAGQNYDTSSLVRISLASEKAGGRTIAAHVDLPVIVRRSRSRIMRRWSAASVGAVLVAMPTILGPGVGVPIAIRLVAALAGAGLLAGGAVLTSPK
jgi:hypothetical protein